MVDSHGFREAALRHKYLNTNRRIYCPARIRVHDKHGEEKGLECFAAAAAENAKLGARLEEEDEMLVEKGARDGEDDEGSSTKTRVSGLGLISPASSTGKAVFPAEKLAEFSLIAHEKGEEILPATPPRELPERGSDIVEEGKAIEVLLEESFKFSTKIKGKGRALFPEAEAPAVPFHEIKELGRGKRKRTRTLRSQERVPERKSLVVKLAVKIADKGKGRAGPKDEDSVLSLSERLNNAREDLSAAEEELEAAEKHLKDRKDASIDTENCWRMNKVERPFEKKVREAWARYAAEQALRPAPQKPAKKTKKKIRNIRNNPQPVPLDIQAPKIYLSACSVASETEENWCGVCTAAKEKLADEINEAVEREERAWREVKRLESLLLDLLEEGKEVEEKKKEEREVLHRELYKLNANAFEERLEALRDVLNKGGFDWERERA